MRKRNRQQLFRTLKNYKLYTTFRLMVTLYNIELSTILQETRQQRLTKSIEECIQYYSKYPTKQLVKYLREKQKLYKDKFKIHLFF